MDRRGRDTDVMPGLAPGIHLSSPDAFFRWIAGSSPAMTTYAHTDAVVTPPSTTMVWPVMKLEASEPR